MISHRVRLERCHAGWHAHGGREVLPVDLRFRLPPIAPGQLPPQRNDRRYSILGSGMQVVGWQ